MPKVKPSPANSLYIGLAGEHLVCADLFARGYNPCIMGQLSKYDILAEDFEKNMLRIQVKTCAQPIQNAPSRPSDNPRYIFRAARHPTSGHKKYQYNDFDILAAVALDIKQVAYIPWSDVSSDIRIPANIEECDNRNRKWLSMYDYPLSLAAKEVLYQNV